MGGESSDFAMLCGTFPNLAADDQLALALTLDLPQGQALVARFSGSDAKAASGGKERLESISKMRNRHIRRLFYLGAVG
ncbi:hypothetical protein [Paracoccus litorisediminis]|uniref:Uncharacterized protein n=1 Tax=Paracoccus litorisediminis TaxID=2006130 RepID=A0A844HW99_9RHOB|nr:hypothetical protein [Paracoccus litorisediminis]MTH62615.1 hypothetical protein [Paracoccus litorisediminis]